MKRSWVLAGDGDKSGRGGKKGAGGGRGGASSDDERRGSSAEVAEVDMPAIVLSPDESQAVREYVAKMAHLQQRGELSPQVI